MRKGIILSTATATIPKFYESIARQILKGRRNEHEKIIKPRREIFKFRGTPLHEDLTRISCADEQILREGPPPWKIYSNTRQFIMPRGHPRIMKMITENEFHE